MHLLKNIYTQSVIKLKTKSNMWLIASRCINQKKTEKILNEIFNKTVFFFKKKEAILLSVKIKGKISNYVL